MDRSVTNHVRKGTGSREQGMERMSIQDQVDNLTVGTLGCAEIGIGRSNG